MSNVFATQSNCATTVRLLDAFLTNEVTPEQFADISKHLEGCPSCDQELDARRRLRTRLRDAVKEQPVDPYLRTRVLANVRAQKRDAGWFGRQRQISAVAAMLLVGVGVFAAYELGHLRWTTASQDSFIATLSQRMAVIMTVGLRNHVHCAVFRKYPSNPRPLETVRQHLPDAYQPVIPMLTAHVPADFRVAIAHECGYGDRGVVHIGLKSTSKLMSLIITRKRAGDRFTSDDATAVLAAAGAPVFTAGAQRFQIAALESREYLVYLVSDVSKEENSRIMLALAPEVRNFLDTLRS
jgi:anti-sigma factor (TIGR02949 family)